MQKYLEKATVTDSCRSEKLSVFVLMTWKSLPSERILFLKRAASQIAALQEFSLSCINVVAPSLCRSFL